MRRQVQVVSKYGVVVEFVDCYSHEVQYYLDILKAKYPTGYAVTVVPGWFL